MKRIVKNVAGTLFGVGALAHLVRLFCPFTIIIGSYTIPLWASGVFFIVAGALSIFLFRLRV